jgi:hypothetical protein
MMRKTLFIISVIALFSVCLNAGAPSPLDWQQSYFKSTKEHQVKILNYDHEIANLTNQVYDLQAINKDLMLENSHLKANPERVYVDREKIIEKTEVPFLAWVGWIGFGLKIIGIF